MPSLKNMNITINTEPIVNSSKLDKISILYPLPILINNSERDNVELVNPLSEENNLKNDDTFGEKIVDVSCGDFHTIAVTKSGNIYCWGLGFSSQPSENSPKTGG